MPKAIGRERSLEHLTQVVSCEHFAEPALKLRTSKMDFAPKQNVARFFVHIFLFVCVLAFESSAVHAANPLREAVANTQVRFQAAKWNIARNIRPTDPASDGLSLVTIAGASKRQLRQWMRECPPPTMQELSGTWLGLNRGVGPAVLGFSQFSKQMCANCCGGHGDNITIRQVAPKHWCSQNWLAVKKNHDYVRKGNYLIERANRRRPSPQGLLLNYGAAENPKCDPSRFLVDKIVKLNDRYLLGQAIYKVGVAKVTVAYFVLERAN